jgi:4-hydroxy-tetrahydrodipicolinate synthase
MFHGSIVALVTPMQSDGTIDLECLRALVEWHIQEGSNGIVIMGSTGEAATLNEAERGLIIQHALEQSNGRIPIIAGTGTNSTDQTIHFTRQAFNLGIDACLVVTPYYNRPTQEGLYLHFKAVAQAVPVPLILYNVPTRTSCDLRSETVLRLAPISNIIGLKDATGDLPRALELLQQCGPSLDLYSGDDPSCCNFILQGGKGVISITSNVAPQLMQQMCKLALKKDASGAHAIDEQLQSLHKFLCIESNPIPVKWALHYMEKIPTGIRLPLTKLSEAHHNVVINAMRLASVI